MRLGRVDGGDQRRVELLDHDGALEADGQRRRIAPDLPRHRAGTEEAVVLVRFDLVPLQLRHGTAPRASGAYATTEPRLILDYDTAVLN